MRNLLRALLSPRNAEDPRAVLHEEIEKNRAGYDALREAALQTLYLRNKLEAELFEQRALVARLHDRARRAVRAGDERAGLEFLESVERERGQLLQLEEALVELKQRAAHFKRKVQDKDGAIRSLQRERSQVDLQRRSLALLQRVERVPTEEAPPRLQAARAQLQAERAQLSALQELEQASLPSPASVSAKIELERLKRRGRQGGTITKVDITGR